MQGFFISNAKFWVRLNVFTTYLRRQIHVFAFSVRLVNQLNSLVPVALFLFLTILDRKIFYFFSSSYIVIQRKRTLGTRLPTKIKPGNYCFYKICSFFFFYLLTSGRAVAYQLLRFFKRFEAYVPGKTKRMQLQRVGIECCANSNNKSLIIHRLYCIFYLLLFFLTQLLLL